MNTGLRPSARLKIGFARYWGAVLANCWSPPPVEKMTASRTGSFGSAAGGVRAGCGMGWLGLRMDGPGTAPYFAPW